VERLQGIPGVRVPAQAAGQGSVHAHHVFPIWIESKQRDAVVVALQQAEVEVVVNYRPVHLTDHFRRTFGHAEGDFRVAERLGDQCISLPYYPGMLLPDIDLVAERLARIMEHQGVVSAADIA
jgi:dTDP-4-amino-4,6-dideoxygalactose transaminase